MKRKILTAAASILAACSLFGGAENLLYNNSFEFAGTDQTKALGWGGRYVREKAGADGSYCIKCLRFDKGYVEASSREIPVTPGADFIVSGKYKGSAYYIYVHFKLADKKTKNLQMIPPTTKDWKTFTFKGKVPENAVNAIIMLRTWDQKNPVYIDDVSFTCGDLGDLLKNGSFEKQGSTAAAAANWRGLGKRVEGGLDGKFMAECKMEKTYCEINSTNIKVKPNAPFKVEGLSKGAYVTGILVCNIPGEKAKTINFPIRSSKDWSCFSYLGTIPEKTESVNLLIRSWDKKNKTNIDNVRFISASPFERAVISNGIKIVLPAQVRPSDITAQKELVNYLGKTVKNYIKINGVQLKTILIGAKNDAMQEEEWKIESSGDTLILSGGGDRGNLYAVYHFLEDIIGVHWWNAWEEFVPAAKNFDLAALSLKGKPYFIHRDVYRTSIISKDNGRFAARNRLSRNADMPISPEYGNAFTWGPPYHAHTFARYVGGQKKKHPEWFSMVDGRREGSQYSGQLCLTNKELRKYLVRRLLGSIKSSRASALANGITPPQMYDLSMNDGTRFCECQNCLPLEKKYGISHVLLDFVNEIASEVGKVYPDVYITTLAYGKTVVPPKSDIRPAKNVLIRYCNTFGPTVYPTEKRNVENQKYLKRWAEISPQLISWEHCLEVYPFPHEMGIAQLARNYAKHKFMGMFVEMSGKPYAADFYDMKVWLYAKIMENPFADFEALRQIYLKGYFGKAAPMIDQYRKMLDRAQKRIEGQKLNRYFANYFSYMNVNELLQAHKLFDDAEKAVAGDEVMLRRVATARAPLNTMTAYNLVKYTKEWKKLHGNKPLPLNREKIADNMEKYWFKEAKFYAKPSDEAAVMASSTAFVRNLSGDVKTVAEPESFKGKNVQHFTPSIMILHRNPNMRLVKDAEAREGCAMEITQVSGKAYYKLPFEAGAWDGPGGKSLLKKTWTSIPGKEGYQWYNVGKAFLHQGCYIYLTRSWSLQAHLKQYLELGGKNLDVWIRAKFEGPAWGRKGSKSRLLVDSITVVEIK